MNRIKPITIPIGYESAQPGDIITNDYLYLGKVPDIFTEPVPTNIGNMVLGSRWYKPMVLVSAKYLDCADIPNGWITVELGDTIQKGDKYFARSGSGETRDLSYCAGQTYFYNSVFVLIRKVASNQLSVRKTDYKRSKILI